MKKIQYAIINLIVIVLFIIVGLLAIAMNTSCTKIEYIEIKTTDTLYVYVKDSTAVIIDSVPIVKSANVFDQSGNEYETIIIGSQTWINSNLRTLKYNDGTDIPTTSVNVRTIANPAFYFNHPQTSDVYYTWYTLDRICPAGYHVPTLNDWKILEDMFEGNAKPIASNNGWINSIYETTVGYNQSENNTSNFNAYPSGNISAQAYGLSYDNKGSMAVYWTSTSDNDELQLYAYIKSIDYNKRLVQTSIYPKNWAFNVRCIKNE